MQSSYPVFPFGSDIQSLEFPTFRKFFVSLHDHFIPHPRNNYHPHAISHRMLALLSLLLMTVKIVGISMVAISPAAIAEASAISPSIVISLTNVSRVEGGLTELTANSQLTKAAQSKADDMLAKQYFAHNTPSGDTPWTFIKTAGYSYVTAGENLAIDFTEAESIQTAWMNSPGHRANIMNKSFQEIGIGISKGMYNGHQTTIVVQMFGTPIAQKVEMPAEPTPVAQPETVATPTAPTPAPAPVAFEPAQIVPPTVSAEQPKTMVVVKDNQLVEVPAPIGTQHLEIKSTETSLQGNKLYLNVTTSSDATKLIATYDNMSVMLDPAENNQWDGYIPLSKLNTHTNLIVYAYDINGNLIQTPVGQFSPSLKSSLEYGAVEGASVSLFGKTFNPKVWEEKIFLIVLASLIACLILAIAIRRHVQHLSLVANTAFVAMLAAFMLMI
jgi:hypothetical protein